LLPGLPKPLYETTLPYSGRARLTVSLPCVKIMPLIIKKKNAAKWVIIFIGIIPKEKND